MGIRQPRLRAQVRATPPGAISPECPGQADPVGVPCGVGLAHAAPFFMAGTSPAWFKMPTYAARTRLGESIRPTTMKNHILPVAREVNPPATIRQVSGGLLAASRYSCLQMRRSTAEPRGRRLAPASRTTVSIGTALRGEFSARHPTMMALLALQPQ